MDAPRLEGGSDGSPLVAAGPLAVREDGSEARLGHVALDLTHAQRLVLAVLVRHRGHAVRRWELYEEAFRRPLPHRSRAVDLHVVRIRRALGPFGACVLSVGRVGYRLDVDALSQMFDLRSSLPAAPDTRARNESH